MNLRILSKTARPYLRIAEMIEPKLSVVRMISAASFATSVPMIMPIEMPTSALRSAGASLTPSPVTATTSPRAWNAETSRSLCSGAFVEENFLPQESAQLGIVHGIELSPVRMIGLGVVIVPTSSGDQFCGEAIVAGDHGDADARLATT